MLKLIRFGLSRSRHLALWTWPKWVLERGSCLCGVSSDVSLPACVFRRVPSGGTQQGGGQKVVGPTFRAFFPYPRQKFHGFSLAGVFSEPPVPSKNVLGHLVRVPAAQSVGAAGGFTRGAEGTEVHVLRPLRASETPTKPPKFNEKTPKRGKTSGKIVPSVVPQNIYAEFIPGKKNCSCITK